MACSHRETLLFCALLFTCCATASVFAEAAWRVQENPYHVRISLDREIASPAVVEVDEAALFVDLAEAAIDQINGDTFAFEKAVIVNPKTGRAVGRFELARLGDPLDIDGSFDGLQAGQSPWVNYVPSKMAIKPVELDGQMHNALMVEEETFGNHKLYQPVQLMPSETYLLEYWLMMDPQENEMGVMLNNPKMSLFAQLPHSYFNKMPPRDEWVRYRVLFQPHERDAQLEVRPIPTDAYLEVHHAFVGKGGVADLKLQ